LPALATPSLDGNAHCLCFVHSPSFRQFFPLPAFPPLLSFPDLRVCFFFFFVLGQDPPPHSLFFMTTNARSFPFLSGPPASSLFRVRVVLCLMHQNGPPPTPDSPPLCPAGTEIFLTFPPSINKSALTQCISFRPAPALFSPFPPPSVDPDVTISRSSGLLPSLDGSVFGLFYSNVPYFRYGKLPLLPPPLDTHI